MQSDAIFTVSMTLRIVYGMGLHICAALCLHVAIGVSAFVLLASWASASFVCVLCNSMVRASLSIRMQFIDGCGVGRQFRSGQVGPVVCMLRWCCVSARGARFEKIKRVHETFCWLVVFELLL